MYTEIANYTLPLTRDLAVEYATRLAWPGDRDLSDSHVAWLKREYDIGKFYGPTWVKARLEDRWYRMDGKHSSIMLADLDGSFPTGLKVNIREFVCETKSDLVALYATFNGRESTRGGADYAKAVMAFHSIFCNGTELRDNAPPPAFAFRLASGIGLVLNPDRRRALIPRERSLLINESPEFIMAASSYAANKLCKVPVCAALFATWKTKSPRWSTFWDEVFNETNVDPGSPTRMLSRILHELHAARVKGHPSNSSHRATFVRCLHAWNAYRSGRTTTLRYCSKNPIPEVEP